MIHASTPVLVGIGQFPSRMESLGEAVGTIEMMPRGVLRVTGPA